MDDYDGYWVFDAYGQWICFTSHLNPDELNPDDIIVKGNAMIDEHYEQDIFYDLEKKQIVFQDYPEGAGNPE